MPELTDHEIVETMMRFGGRFMQRLGAAALYADPQNLAKLKAAFAVEWEDYRKLTVLRLKRKEETT